MERLIKGLVLFAILSLTFFTQKDVSAQINVSGGFDFVSKYVWRGFKLANKPTVQPTLDFGMGNSGLALNVWGSYAVASRNLYSAADELDFTLTHSSELGGQLGLTLGFIYYTFPTQTDFNMSDHTSKEAFVTVAPSILPFSPELSVFYDFDLGNDLYANLSFSRDLSMGMNLLSLGASIGYNNGQFGTKSGISHIDFSVSTELGLGGFTLSPRAVYVVAPEASVNPDNQFYVGLSLSR